MTKSVFLSHRIFITQHVEHLQSGTYKVHSQRKSYPPFAIHPILPGTCGDGVWWLWERTVCTVRLSGTD